MQTENVNLSLIVNKVQSEIHKMTNTEFSFQNNNSKVNIDEKVLSIIRNTCKDYTYNVQKRIEKEFLQLGPIEALITDESITEILINGPESIWYEKNGQLHQYQDKFLNHITFQNFIHRILEESKTQLTLNQPYLDTFYQNFRLALVGGTLTLGSEHISLRRHPKNSWTFNKLIDNNWCTKEQCYFLKDLISSKKNFIIIGPTGSGKTSVLNAFLNQLDNNERVITIEDTPEISLPNSASMKLLTRIDHSGNLPPIRQSDLVKKSLRLRPDRIIMGEVRGEEAKDFLMALSTGHEGSFATLHAQNPYQSLIRLEMLIQLGAPEWNLQAIRRLIQLSLQYIVVTEKSTEGHRQLQGVYKISSLEEYGFTIEKII